MPDPPAITVMAVTVSGADLIWTFSSAVTLTGPDVSQLEFDSDGTGNWQLPVSCAQASATQIRCTYEDTGIAGLSWRILTAPVNIAESASITVPQSGTIS